MRLWRAPDWSDFWCLLLQTLVRRSGRARLRVLHPDLEGSRIRTVLERITCAAMLRMQTLVCFPERCYGFVVNFPGFALDV